MYIVLYNSCPPTSRCIFIRKILPMDSCRSTDHLWGQIKDLSSRHFSQSFLAAAPLHIVPRAYVRNDLTKSAAVSAWLSFLECRSDSLHPAWRFWNLISSQRVKGYRPRLDLAENGACAKRFTPWTAVGEVQEFSGEWGLQWYTMSSKPLPLAHLKVYPHLPTPGLIRALNTRTNP